MSKGNQYQLRSPPYGMIFEVLLLYSTSNMSLSGQIPNMQDSRKRVISHSTYTFEFCLVDI